MKLQYRPLAKDFAGQNRKSFLQGNVLYIQSVVIAQVFSVEHMANDNVSYEATVMMTVILRAMMKTTTMTTMRRGRMKMNRMKLVMMMIIIIIMMMMTIMIKTH